jgi:dipeptidyl-peptidase-3
VGAFFLPEYRAQTLRYFRPLVRPLMVYMHEIIGHGSGRPAPDLAGDPRVILGRTYSTLEECRADLVALWHIADPKLVEIGAFRLAEQRAVVEVAYVSYLQGWLSRIDRLPGLEVREAHNRAHHAILSYLCAGGAEAGEDYGVEVIRRDGDFYVRVHDLESARAGVGEMLASVQRIKSTADRNAAEALFDRFGARVDAEWKANVAARRKRIRTPKFKAFVFPRLEPVLERGEIVDVRIRHDEDLTAQQLRFSRLEMSREIAEDRPAPAPQLP